MTDGKESGIHPGKEALERVREVLPRPFAAFSMTVGPEGEAFMDYCQRTHPEAMTDIIAYVDGLDKALERVASSEAFDVATPDIEPELLARMWYAQKAREGVPLEQLTPAIDKVLSASWEVAVEAKTREDYLAARRLFDVDALDEALSRAALKQET